MSNDKESIKVLYETIANITEANDVELFFGDLCTFKEIEAMAQRIKAAKMLMQGSTYEEIIKETNISSATLSRVSKCVKYGEGYKKILK
ncbi:MAG: TrpR-related protein YerC/YecD [Clostridia bacterium]|nr:TrpR-related protein YerC/YecD [Clostridia bacterium]